MTWFQATASREAIGSRPLLPMAGVGGACLRGLDRVFGTAAGLVVYSHASVNLPDADFRPIPDGRFDRLEKFFQRYNCPEPKHVEDYIRAADGHGLDYRLLPAIAIRETHCGMQDTRNNHWGYHPGRQAFASIEQGIDFVAEQLADNPPYKGKTLEQKLFVYNPFPQYPAEVMRIMRQIE